MPLLVIDGGNSKTDVAVVTTDGEVLGYGRGPGFHPDIVGAERAVRSVASMVEEVLRSAGGPRPQLVAAFLANVDLPQEVQQVRDAISSCDWADSTYVENDTFAVLRTGTAERRGIAVVCGAGINCVGLLPDGRTARFLALGALSGDWGGGMGLAAEVMWWSVRAEDGRGPATALAAATATQLGLPSATAVAEAVHLGHLSSSRLHELVPLLFEIADSGDAVAGSLVRRQAEEILSMAAIALRRLDLLSVPTDVVLGGGILTAGHPLLLSAVTAGLAVRAPLTRVSVLSASPIVGASLLGLDQLPGAADIGARQQSAREARLRADFARVLGTSAGAAVSAAVTP